MKIIGLFLWVFACLLNGSVIQGQDIFSKTALCYMQSRCFNSCLNNPLGSIEWCFKSCGYYLMTLQSPSIDCTSSKDKEAYDLADNNLVCNMNTGCWTTCYNAMLVSKSSTNWDPSQPALVACNTKCMINNFNFCNPTPTNKPTLQPTKKPTLQPTNKPTLQPTKKPTLQPTKKPTLQPTKKPVLVKPTKNGKKPW